MLCLWLSEPTDQRFECPRMGLPSVRIPSRQRCECRKEHPAQGFGRQIQSCMNGNKTYRGTHGNSRLGRSCKTPIPRRRRNGRRTKNPLPLGMGSVNSTCTSTTTMHSKMLRHAQPSRSGRASSLRIRAWKRSCITSACASRPSSHRALPQAGSLADSVSL